MCLLFSVAHFAVCFLYHCGPTFAWNCLSDCLPGMLSFSPPSLCRCALPVQNHAVNVKCRRVAESEAVFFALIMKVARARSGMC
jgi:hypothetical protein